MVTVMMIFINSLGNNCKRMVRGIVCSKSKCSWVHYMHRADAASQFFRFYRFFTNLEVQEQMVVEAQELLTKTDPGEVIEVYAKYVCRDVLKAMVKVVSQEILVSLFHQTRAEAGHNPAAPRLLKCSWGKSLS